MNDFNKLLEKYWKGESNRKEEKNLSELLQKKNSRRMDNDFFTYLESKRNEKLPNPDFEKDILSKMQGSRKLNTRLIISIAASITLVVVLSVSLLKTDSKIITQNANTINIDTYSDPSEAYKATRQALLMVSANLNKGQKYSQELARFDKTQEKLKN